MAITFSFKDKKKIEQEKYNYPVLTQKPYDESKKGTVAKFAMNKSMLDSLGYPKDLKDCKISIARDEDTNEIVLINSTGMETDHQYNVVSDGSFNSKFLLGRIKKSFPDVDALEGCEFHKISIETDEESAITYARLCKKLEDSNTFMESLNEILDELCPVEEFLPSTENMIGEEHQLTDFERDLI